MCLNPRWIYKKGFYKQDNYRGYQGEFYEIGTYSKCGHCCQCIAEKSNNWVIRNYYESKIHEKKSFITLTYKNNRHILIRKDIQDFMKRLRIELDRKGLEKVRMFYAGEYGELNNRPHNHIILYGYENKRPRYLDINKKGNIIYQDDFIHELWGMGRTSYQRFNEYEAPYIALYNTAKEEMKKAYILTRKNVKVLQNIYQNMKNENINTVKNAINTLNKAIEEMEKEKKKYTTIKEYNGWSIALGWEKFYEDYCKTNSYTWKEYIEGKEFVTPTPWVKKLANMGDYNAIKEMKRREEMIEESASEEEERIKNEFKLDMKRKKELLEWKDTKNEVEEL